MEFVDNSVSPIKKAVWGYKKIYKYLVLSVIAICWAYTSISFCIDDDLLIFLLFFIVASIIGLVVSYVCISKVELNVYQGGIVGKSYFGKNFSLSIENIHSVQNNGINGIKIIDNNRKIYKFVHIKNRDELCTAMGNLGISVDLGLLNDEGAIITSEPDIKKHTLFKNISIVSVMLANIFITISAFWFNSSSNYYTYKSTEYYYYLGYSIPYETTHWGYSWYPEEMPTTYIALAFFICFVIFFVVYLVRSNNKVSINSTIVKGVNRLGKTTLIPIEQITGATISAKSSSISINRMGKIYKYHWLINNTLLCSAISNIKSGNNDVVMSEKQYNNIHDVLSVAIENIQTNSIVDSAEEIKKFKELLDEGIISQEEFDIKKKQILDL